MFIGYLGRYKVYGLHQQ